MSKALIVYYSRKGENYWNGSIRNLEKGNSEIVAEMIADMTGGDLFEVDTVRHIRRIITHVLMKRRKNFAGKTVRK